MRPSDLTLNLTGAAAAAVLLAGCHQDAPDWTAAQDTAVCTDRAGHRVADAECDRAGQAAYSGHGGGYGSPFLWYYLGRGSALPYYGDRVAGGSFTRTAGATYFHAPVATSISRAGAVSRGGFGASAHAFGGFGE